MSDLVGRTLGQYRIIEQLGKGGMATVYRAFQPSLERSVALKVLMPYFAHEEGFSKRFVREAKAIARLDHPHILPIYDFGQEGDIHYIVMKCVDAGSLKDLEAGQPIPLDVCVDILSQIADALDHAHQHGVIHRDVKPANVLMDRGHWVFLTDFGLARMVEGSQQLTASGVGVGTPAYMAPEQCQGREIDRRADIYSLGIVLYEMLTGCVPFEAETPLAVVLKHITEPLPMPRTINPDISETVELVVLKALAKEPDDRYQSAGEMAAALCNAVECAEMEALAAAPEPPSPAVVLESTFPEDKGMPHVQDPGPRAQSTASAPLWAVDGEVSGVGLGAAAPGPPVRAAESVVPARPAESRWRAPWWGYVAVAIVALLLAGGGIWLGMGGWSALTARVSPGVTGDPTPTSAAVQGRAPTSTPLPAEPTPVPETPAGGLRIGISVTSDPRAEVGAQRLEELLTDRTGGRQQVIVVDDRESLVGMLRAGELDGAILTTPEYLWLRDEEAIPLDPVLYVGPVFGGVVVVRADGPVQNIDDLRGQPVILPSWNALAGLLGRAVLMEQGLALEQESELLYVTDNDVPEASVEALSVLNAGEAVAAIVPNMALERAKERMPSVDERVRVLAESRPTSAGVVAIRHDAAPDPVAALREALLEIDPELFRAGTFLGRLVAVDEPLADNLADALHRTDLSARQLVEGRTPELPVPVSSDVRIGLLPGAGTVIEGNRILVPVVKSMMEASRDLGLEATVRETPEGEVPAEAALDMIAQGYNAIVATGWRDPDILLGLAREHQDVSFVYLGHGYAERVPNLLSFAYRMDQAGFLAGALAGKATDSRRVAVIGGIPAPAVEQLVSGFDQGARHTCPGCEVVVQFTDSFDDLALGEEFGRQVVQEGADVVFNAAGMSGSAAIRSAAAQGAWVIGVDVNEYNVTFQNGQAPNADHVLGSVVIRVGAPVRGTIERLARGEFEPGSYALGVREGVVEFLPVPDSAHPRWPELEQHMREVTEGLASGAILP
jgi:basic membrane lipoprotein Med (substrate-binding protein (PBP1-ABC) superfamily)/ABC-type phosphate/phosphonate transport system substrate-binding protein